MARWLRTGALIAVAFLLGTALLNEDSNATALAGPMGYDNTGSFVSEGFTSLAPGESVAATLYGTLLGNEPATVTGVRIIPVPGTRTPTLRHVALLTGLGSGGIHGWPAHNPDFQHQPLIGVPFDPDRYIDILVGYQVHGRGLYAIGGLEVDYTVGGRPHHTRIYGALIGCVRIRCTDDLESGVTQAVEYMAGYR